jgi:rod shape-determining protein MreD
MNKYVVYFLVLVALASVNMVFPSIFGAVPNLLFLFVIFYAFHQDKPTFLWLAFWSGLLLDMSSGYFFGTWTISFLLVAIIVNYSTKIIFATDVSRIFMVVVSAVAYLVLVGLLYIFTTLIFNIGLIDQQMPLVYLQKKVWFDIILNFIFAIPIYLLTEYIEQTILESESRNKNLL